MRGSHRKTGYMGKIMVVDLSNGTIETETIPHTVYESFLSGMGLAAHVLYHRIPEGVDPLGPDNMLGFVSGLLTGTGSLFTGRWMIASKSPLTGTWGEANCGGNFSPAIKRCGVDGIFFKGTSPKPVYLYVDDNRAELRDATLIWGKDTVETEEYFIEKHFLNEDGFIRSDSSLQDNSLNEKELKKYRRKKVAVACIGPSGEKLSLISGVSTDKGRMAARSGLGAVMGSKRLKAVVLSGTRRIHPHNREEIKRLSRICNRWVQFQPPLMPGFLTAPVGALMRLMPWVMTQDGLLYKIFLRKWGTVSMNQISVEMGDSPIKNWKGTSSDWGFFKSLSSNPDTFTEKETQKYHCYSCPLGCGGICKTTGKYQKTHKPEYETVLSLGGFVMNKDMDIIFQLNEMLNRAGMDTISAGHVVAFAMECYENGLITKEDTDGVPLKWGEPDAITWLIEKMISREGIGDILADGVKRASMHIGEKSTTFAAHAGGQELAMHDGRNDPGYALHYSVEAAPGRHTYGSGIYYEMYQLWKRVKGIPKIAPFYSKKSKYVPDKKHARIGKANSEFMNIMNGSGVCMFGGFMGANRIRIFDWLNAATGWNHTPEKYMEIGSQIQTLKQAFNIKQGVEPSTLALKERVIGHPPQEKGANKGRSVPLETMMEDYWELYGWDKKTGKPSPEQIEAVSRI
ncbi:Aor1 [Desulfamplus magnetovallimortis]|uniref:Aor1 n=1 Tax=Desulfamplus magnetovallimortis TaxID=1246637 RepID=A0A1W1H622_9BACT|nr:aldehyde ferredoxin oxidoreductase family protein [Desulfamplus magnetovallimortis]SLM27886.1 Aor1 [Desulfamplus magnetovallimortis]